MFLMHGRLFRSGRAGRDSARASVITHVVYRDIIHCHGLIVDVGDVGDIVHGSIVEESTVVPISALIAYPNVAKAIVNAAIESDVRPPIAFVKDKDAITPTPVTRRP